MKTYITRTIVWQLSVLPFLAMGALMDAPPGSGGNEFEPSQILLRSMRMSALKCKRCVSLDYH